MLDIIQNIIDNEMIDENAIEMLRAEREYILDDDVIELINEVEYLLEAYFKNEIEKTTLIEEIRLKYEPYHSPLHTSDLDDKNKKS